MSVLPTCPERVLYQQESGLKSLISPAPFEALHFPAVLSCGFTSVAQTDVKEPGGGGSSPCSVQRLRNNHPEHSRVLGQFTKMVSRSTDGHFYARGDLGHRAGKHLPAAGPSCWEELCSSLGFP